MPQQPYREDDVHRVKPAGMPKATDAPATRGRGSVKRRRGTPARQVTLYDDRGPIGTVWCAAGGEPAVGTRAPDVLLRRSFS